MVEVPKPLPLPGRLMPLPGKLPAATAEPADPRAMIEAANNAARIQPSRTGYINAVQIYPFTEGALYQLYGAPGRITDVALQIGEQLTGPGPVARGTRFEGSSAIRRAAAAPPCECASWLSLRDLISPPTL